MHDQLGLAGNRVTSHSLSENDDLFNELVSTTPLDENDPALSPFGKTLHVTFSAPTIDSVVALGMKGLGEKAGNNDDSSKVDHFDFHLSLDPFSVSTAPGHHSTLHTQVNGMDTIEHPKHTSFKGVRMNEMGQTETLLLTILPTSGEFLQTNPLPGEHNDRLETQDVVEFGPLSGRMDGQFTVVF